VSPARRPAAELADATRQARELLARVRESRWPGFAAPAPQAPAPAKAAGRPAARAATPPGRPPRAAAPRPEPAAPAAAAASVPRPEAARPWESLDAIAAAAAACTRCPLHATRRRAVPGEGNARARLMFVGEAPGADEDAQGRPFVGAAGKLLDKMIAAMGLARGEVFIANVLKCRPPGNRDPQPPEVASCLPYLRAQIGLVRPEIICALGRHAAHALLGTQEALGRLRERFHDLGGTPLLVSYHPSYLLRTPGDKTKAWRDLQIVMKRLGLQAPVQNRDPDVWGPR